MLLVALLSRGRHGLRRGGASPELLELVEGCFLQGVFYAEPHMMPGTERSKMLSAVECQRRCANVEGCRHFTYWPDGGCLLTDATSKPHAAPYEFSETIVGPPSCHPALQVAKLPADTAAQQSVPAAVVPGLNGTRCENYPACRAVGLEGHCCPNREQISLGCCEGFPLTKPISV
ncbi:unnamed protein product [Durusdinium trenchii]|uniref:Apple domain-containing protein n=1 Tax=Durusdinium trenchii TaxID=1381693 RepID=A0ABP0KRZ3_9DINO